MIPTPRVGRELVQPPGAVGVVEATGERDGEVNEWFTMLGGRPKSWLVEFVHTTRPQRNEGDPSGRQPRSNGLLVAPNSRLFQGSWR